MRLTLALGPLSLDLSVSLAGAEEPPESGYVTDVTGVHETVPAPIGFYFPEEEDRA